MVGSKLSKIIGYGDVKVLDKAVHKQLERFRNDLPSEDKRWNVVSQKVSGSVQRMIKEGKCRGVERNGVEELSSERILLYICNDKAVGREILNEFGALHYIRECRSGDLSMILLAPQLFLHYLQKAVCMMMNEEADRLLLMPTGNMRSLVEIKKEQNGGVGLLVRFFRRFSQEYVTGKEGLDRAMARYVKVHDKIVEAILKLEKPTITNCSMFHNDLARQLADDNLILHEFVEEFGVLAYAQYCLMKRQPLPCEDFVSGSVEERRFAASYLAVGHMALLPIFKRAVITKEVAKWQRFIKEFLAIGTETYWVSMATPFKAIEQQSVSENESDSESENGSSTLSVRARKKLNKKKSKKHCKKH